ncbi:juvenile hormone epoxide hydrolase 1-like [Diabrotica undecimpunctata]|uniref:juvenile hormone epoxide hydrolase 1-like n=1 Tax=Diabrotica undecimpunctata TaxID=50387 RepID=UPI003B639083
MLLILTLFSVIAYIAYKKFKKLMEPPPLPQKLEEKWWGPGAPGSIKPEVKPFTINVSDEVLKDLQYRLDHHRPFTPPLEGIVHEYGINTNLVKTVTDYWRTKYNWREREKYLNQYPQFTLNIQGLDLHYVHIKPKVSSDIKVLPLLILHGWPGSVREFYELFPLLTTPQKGRNFVFEVIAPHIPGFGFSKPAVRPGLSPDNIALVFKNMMHHLGFKKFYAQGGDFGSIILRNMVVLYPEVIEGFHCNFPVVTSARHYIKLFFAGLFPSLSSWYVRPEHREKVFPIKQGFERTLRETGYLHEQATKPDTLGVAMNESPIGLAAYILEKFVTATNHQTALLVEGGLSDSYTYDSLLDNIMFYWLNSAATTSFRLYSETFNKANNAKGILQHPIEIPTAVARYKYDFYSPDGAIEDIFVNCVHFTDIDGGHFSAFEKPEVFANDLYDGIEKIERLKN